MIPLSVTEDDKEHTMHYFENLPYVDLLDKEGELWIKNIYNSLVIGINAKDFNRTVLASVKSLSSYLDVKHAVSKEMRVNLIKILYNLIVIPGIDANLLETSAGVCIKLMKNEKKLKSQDLELEWKPLYKFIQSGAFPKLRQDNLNIKYKLQSAIRLVDHAKRFFSANATKEILTEFLPQFTPHSVSSMLRAQGFLVLFLPTEDQERYTIHVKDYLPTVYSLWSIFACSPTYDAQFTFLVSAIAQNNLNQSGSEIGVFTKEQVKSVFTVGLRMMNLPVGSRTDGSNTGSGAASGTTTGYGSRGQRVDSKSGNAYHLVKKHEKHVSLAKFIVYTIIPEHGNDKSSYSLSLLSDLIQATELYFHPSNHGHWSYMLTEFIRNLAYGFLKRWRQEQEEDCATPVHRRLTADVRKEFVSILKPVAYLSMFGKDNYLVSMTQSTLKYLAWIEPSLVFPGLLERIYPSLETLTETHRTSSALGILTEIALPLFSRDHYPAGGKHLLPLLQLAIPGIDMNDPMKTIASLMFISTAIASIPLQDTSTSPTHYYPTEEDVDSPFAELSRETEDYLVKASTAGFEEWVANFLRRVFTIFENLPQETRKKQGGAMELGIVQVLMHTCHIVFDQLPDSLYGFALRSVSEFVSDHVLPNAIRPTGLLCDALTLANPNKAASVLVPLCISNIEVELEHGAGSSVTHAASSDLIPSDATFHWYQHILFSVVSNLGDQVLPYRHDLIRITQRMTECKSRRGMMWTGKVIRQVLTTTLSVYPKESKSLVPSVWRDQALMESQAHQLWGKPGNPTKIEIEWHTPSEDEKEFGLSFLDQFLMPAVARLRELIRESSVKDSHGVSNEFCRLLAVVRNCMIGSSTLVAEDGVVVEDQEMTDGDELDEGDSDLLQYPCLEVAYAFTDPKDPRTQKAKDIRRTVGELIHELAEFFVTKRENDVESIKILIKLTRHFLSERGVEKSQLERYENGYSYAKNIIKTPMSKKIYPRYLLVRRAHIYHLNRLYQNSLRRCRTRLHDALLLDLLELSLGPYAEIRKASQHALSACIRCYRGSRTLILPALLKNLDPGNPPDRMKGALYLLTHKSIQKPCLTDWRFIPTFIIALCRAQHQDKLSIQELVRKIYVECVSRIRRFSFHVVTPAAGHHPLTILAEKRVTKAQTAYRQLIQSLLDLVEDERVHWRYGTMAAHFIELLIQPEEAPTGRLARFATKAALSELPSMRRIGISTITLSMLHIKQRTLAQGDLDALVTGDVRHPLKIEGDRATFSDPLRTVMMDDMRWGWYVWPEKVEGYRINPEGFLFENRLDEASREAFEAFREAFRSPAYWRQLTAYLSQEVDPKQQDRFSWTRARFFSSVFQTLGPDLVRGPIEELGFAADQRHAQRAASEILGGLVRGIKHWSLAHQTATWDWLIPLLSRVFRAITPDSLGYWENFVRFSTRRRDPRRIQPLLRLLVETELDPQSDAAFHESQKLLLVRAMIASVQWRLESPGLIGRYLEWVQHPYKQVREVIGVNLNALIQIEWVPGYASVDALLEANAVTDGVGLVPTALSPLQQERLDLLIQRLDQWQVEMKQSNQSLHGSSDYAHASKTILCWLHQAFKDTSVSGTLCYILPLIPKLFEMQEVHDDQDLQQMATRVLTLLAQTTFPPSMLERVTEEFLKVLTSTESWHRRHRALPVLQIFIFKNLFGMSLLRVMQVIGQMLMDSQLEVRQLASVTLGGLVRCSQRDAVQSLIDQFGASLTKRKRAESTLQKHAGVLGLSCLIYAFPYEIPEWMPFVLCQLADCISDPATEIQTTIRKTFSDFRRTHSDTWHEDMHKFTEEQLSILSDMLISPSYYA